MSGRRTTVILVIALAAVAATAVVAYSRWREAQPELAELSTRRAHQLAAVALVLARAIEGISTAMGMRSPEPAMARGPRLIDIFDEDLEDFR
jgi:hypothetical protein